MKDSKSQGTKKSEEHSSFPLLGLDLHSVSAYVREVTTTMGDSKRWTVTYTKHIKQKRKFFKSIVGSDRKSTLILLNCDLYDECEKLLECRLLKKDETVTSGETLVFNGYLVDIGDSEGDNKLESDFKVDRKNKNESRFRTPSDTKMNARENIARARKPLSPSQRIIKEFKKRELFKYGSPKISQETPKSDTTGMSLQVMLSDANRKLLDSRFVKKDDIIRPGESIVFDTYLVDIGEDQGSHRQDSCVQGDNCTNVERMEKMDRQQTSLDSDAHVTVGKREWQVLYTTQLTQKAKKYHDGFLQLEICGSLGRQIVLYDLSKRTLERRFLKKDEVIRVGESVYFDGHLVDVGEPEGSHQSPVKLNERRTGNHVVERRQLRHGQNGHHKVNPSVAKGQPLSPRRHCLGQDAGLNSLFPKIEDIKSNRIVSPIKPLRDANQILSILQDPKPQESYVTDKEAQTNMSGADFGLFTSTPDDHSSCLISNEGKSAEGFSSERETFPSFDLGF
ncbi:hypothetical protein SESBI_23723 [Sesbania bispinosa]|nr:hypothetical protein SESBI_23723 [Sesbania bispinosa]